MSDYLLLFRNESGDGQYRATSQDMAIDLPLWQAWIGRIAAEGKLIFTAPIRYDAAIVDANGLVSTVPYIDSRNVLVSGFLICSAEDVQMVQEWSKTCPILRYPGSSVEIRPVIPFPSN